MIVISFILMSSKDIKDLLIINLTTAIALATSTLLPKDINIIGKTHQIDTTTACYWLCIALLLICYMCVNSNESRQKNISITCLPKIEDAYFSMLKLNLLFNGVLIIVLVICYWLQALLIYLPIFSCLVLLCEAIMIAYYPVSCFLASYFTFDIYKISNPIMLMGGAIFFGIALYLLVFL